MIWAQSEYNVSIQQFYMTKQFYMIEQFYMVKNKKKTLTKFSNECVVEILA